MKLIFLDGKNGAGLAALVDDIDFPLVSSFRWVLGSNGYVERGKNKIGMAREVVKPKKGEFVDHINGNKLDNRRCNLRAATVAENNRNTGVRKSNTSNFKGVSFEKGKWRAAIMVNRKTIYLGRFMDKVEAARTYNVAAKKYFGEFAWLNPVG